MNKFTGIGLVLLSVAGCGQPPEPTGPAAEATTSEVEVVMPEDTTAKPSTEPTTLVSFKVPGMS